jgi:hypothetical protein
VAEETGELEEARPKVVAEADEAGTRENEVAMPSVSSETETSALKMLAFLALAPLIGLAYVVFLPFIGLGMLLVALGMGLAEKLGWV